MTTSGRYTFGAAALLLVVAAVAVYTVWRGQHPSRPQPLRSSAKTADEPAAGAKSPAGSTRSADNFPKSADASAVARRTNRKPDDPKSQDAPANDDPLARGVRYLLSQQGFDREENVGDGLWRSPQYGTLRGGAGSTALVLYALATLPEERRAAASEAIARGFAALEPGIEKQSQVSNPDGSLDFPAYGTALLLLADQRPAGDRLSDENRRRLVNFLLQSQLAEGRGVLPDSPHYGGWEIVSAGGNAGQATTDPQISVTSFALEALAGIGQQSEADVAAAIARGLQWAQRCQFSEGSEALRGGFSFVPPGNNLLAKAGWIDEDSKRGRPYGTATCDGIHCLLAGGLSGDDAQVRAAVDWLVRADELDYVPGFEDEKGVRNLLCEAPEGPSRQKVPDPFFTQDATTNRWRDSLEFYYLFRLAGLLPLLPGEVSAKWRAQIRQILHRRQRDDGSWQNDATRNREDDPLIATAFAVAALAEIDRQE